MTTSVSRHIQLIAPSGYCQNQAAARRGVDYFLRLGHQVSGEEVIIRRFQRFAGSDAQRLADWQHLTNSPQLPDIVLAVRGGYGATRLLPFLDFAALAVRLKGQPLAICGHSDFTALQMALLSQCGLISFSGPMLAGNFGAEHLSEFTLSHFWQALTCSTLHLEWQTSATTLDVTGTVWGGNLSMLASLAGTPWLPVINDGILVIEDVNEHPFRIERMLLQLTDSGILAGQRAIIAGSFTGSNLADYDHGYNFASVWELISQRTGLPVITGLPFGHDRDTVTLPLGAHGHLQAEGTRCRLTLSGHPTLR
ncbi:muramoyltetrapeptide carboxypeptidase [Erwinia sp. OLTSP20]|uniref:muramoyltetrapeptide carboxypeptidase n=1 Tax=unclassified Erwinia TaxID=2622719 RepID=UPI000C1A1978|nr:MULTISPECIES: muramoyltetrapeptide carboxypeptidase [unclassified Erwinia]PIJ49222.1 muramoyltetrapeptide carboxypeptidase [Erwinia sp. OAMSP11]PIJ70504.1 muramoyltetrapeptide carboxypeptidase [Erwinia sp. OLSSP12]PIJ78746.1 muramoyltetrapeptide carboxypeptidase [Erwinia sp. OLCASP19]PIJ81231.1 muramoyltetrapeptide carboxypeptidase [Erwinia sp. OLMTSP26]PIJ84480.1 muramoyltetrapeptide carboxypeptidase [Erwinia sp. OLMDSP33]